MIYPARADLILRRNADYDEIFEAFDDDGTTPLSLTGYSAAFEIRLYGAQPGTALISLTPAIVTNAITLTIPRVLIEALPAAAEAGSALLLVYDIVLIAPDAKREVWFEGPVTVLPGVART